MRAQGQILTSSASKVPISATAYTEPTSGAQRSFKSSSVNDAAAGTGARKVKVTYYNLVTNTDGSQTITGPFNETVALNGTTAVATVSTTIALIESIVVVSAGSGGVADGTITLYVNNAGGGGTITTLASGDTTTHLGVHYVPSNRQCEVTDLRAFCDNASAPGLVWITKINYPLAVEQTIRGPFPCSGAQAQIPGATFADSPHHIYSGPARIRMQVQPGDTSSTNTYAEFGYIDRTRVGVI